MPRLFLAAWPPDAIVDALRRLPRPEASNVRWVPSEQWHVTLRFLGEADVGDVSALLDGATLPSATAVLGPTVRRLGRGMLVVPVDGLDELAAAVHHATAGVGKPPEGRGFRGHITIARRRGDAPLPMVGEPVAGTFDVDRVALVRSDLRSSGATYTTVGRWRTR